MPNSDPWDSFVLSVPHLCKILIILWRNKQNYSLIITKYTPYLSLVVRKPAFCIYENKDADQLRGNREADQHLCFCYTDTTIPLLPKSEISSLYPSPVAVQPGLCRTWSETPKTGFLTPRLIWSVEEAHYLAHQIGKQDVLSWVRNSYITHIISPKAHCLVT